MIQIRNVPERTHRLLKERALRRNQSLSDYLKTELQLIAERPTIADLADRIRRQPPVDLNGFDSVQVLREERDGR